MNPHSPVMSHRMLAAASALGLLSLAWPASALAAPPPVVSTWKPDLLPDGQPNIDGWWMAGGTVEVGGKQVDTRGGTYDITGGPLGGGGEDEVLQVEKPRREGKPLPAWPSKIVDPQDGQIPYQPWARAHQKDIEAHVDNPTKQEYLDPQERCFTTGAVRNMFHYDFEIKQFPGYVVITHSDSRIIPIDGGGPHPDQRIKLWNGDSRGHWEGNTLVVDVANNNSKGRLDRAGNFASDKVHIVERYTFLDKDNFIYQATIEDPTVYTRPFTVSTRLIRIHKDEPGYEHWEYECWEHEKNTKQLAADIDEAARKAAKAKP